MHEAFNHLSCQVETDPVTARRVGRMSSEVGGVSPADTHLWLLNLDLPPLFGWMGDHGRTSRAWLLDRRDASLRPLPTRNENQFQMHSTWSADGVFIYYHGRDRATGHVVGQDGGGHYIGAAESRVGGRVAWERVFTHFHYGHVSSHTRRNAIVIDSLVTPDLLLEIDFLRVAHSEAAAPMAVLGRHGSAVRYGAQASHPHAQVSPDGRCIDYNRAANDATGASDVCVLWLDEDIRQASSSSSGGPVRPCHATVPGSRPSADDLTRSCD